MSEFIDRGKKPFLDLGCGDGSFTRNLNMQEVYGIDIDPRNITQNDSGLYREQCCTKASALPFDDLFFSTVFSNCAVEHMDELDGVLNEVARVLQVGGEFIFTVPVPRFIHAMKNDVKLKAIGLNDDAVIDEYNAFHHHVNILGVDQWKTRLKAAGLTVVRYKHYLPYEIGKFVVRMDCLYTVKRGASEDLLLSLEKSYRSWRGLPLRMLYALYIRTLFDSMTGTHVIIKAKKDE